MPTYAIGDIQGCYQPFLTLLQTINFDPHRDTLWLTGDLVNRGPQSLDVLRYVRDLGERHQVVLGNHDLHLLAVSEGVLSQQAGDTLTDILASPDRNELMNWLRFRPMLVQDEKLGYVMTHAGLAPAWTLSQAKLLAKEVEAMLQSSTWQLFFPHMYGNQPDRWSDDLAGNDRMRCIINHFTRMRYCHADGRLELSSKGAIKDQADSLIPWFDVKPRLNADVNIIFGHWAALQGEVDVPNLYALDTGCVWGNKLSALRLEDGARFAVPCAISR
jgi:bis(5'-nucleosyl)-tetraphosphatase (symmetrical)